MLPALMFHLSGKKKAPPGSANGGSAKKAPTVAVTKHKIRSDSGDTNPAIRTHPTRHLLVSSHGRERTAAKLDMVTCFVYFKVYTNESTKSNPSHMAAAAVPSARHSAGYAVSSADWPDRAKTFTGGYKD
jgi:hypothetical protein